MTRMNIHDGGFNARSAFADLATAVAAGSGDNTESDGVWVDREDASSGIAMSAKLVIAYEAVLAENETLSLTVNIQDDDDSAGGGTPADFGTAYVKTVVATGGSGGSTERGTLELDFDLGSARQYLRSQITPDLSRGATDTANVSAAWVFFGAKNGPMSQSAI